MAGIISALFGEKEKPRLADWIAGLGGTVMLRKTFPARQARYGSFGEITPELVRVLKERGVERLYTHQSEAVACAMGGKDVVVSTSTASGKTLCYNLPVADAVLRNKQSRALYIFPTKALAQDQLSELTELSGALGGRIKAFTYDGDTPAQARTKARSEANVIITNPDMLNAGILPHHTKWADFFRNLKYIVVDELHTYRGIFGSHLANLFCRLLRICEFYGARPVFICCSATIANPLEHAAALTRRGVCLIEENGAPCSERELIIYNPPVVNRQSGARRPALFETARIATEALSRGVSSIVFSRTRTGTELLLKALRRGLDKRGLDPNMITGYRGGYLPKERRAIEQALRSGELRGVVSTNALELGIDIGSLDFVILNGYPGSIASTWQQIGRAGRRDDSSLAVLVASALPLDQFIASKPHWFLGASPELARIDPRNPYIRVAHIKCAAFELPFAAGESFGGEDIGDILEYLASHRVLHKSENGGDAMYHWQDTSYPAAELSMRSATGDTYTITEIRSGGRPKVIGTMDRHSAPTLLFPGAVYFHGGETFLVRELDRVNMRCFVERTEADYYTEGESSVRISVSAVFEESGLYGWGEVCLATTPCFYKKIKLTTRENVGSGEISLPEEEMETTACWISLPEQAKGGGAVIAANGLAGLIRNVAPLLLMCDGGDVIVNLRPNAPGVGRSAIFIVDNIPGGVGLAEGVFELKNKLIAACLETLDSCGCEDGCPACVGTPEPFFDAKNEVRELIGFIQNHQ